MSPPILFFRCGPETAVDMTEAEKSSNPDVVVTFHPQEWVDSPGKSHESGRKQLIPADDRQPVSFVVQRADGTDADGNPCPDESYEANQLQDHPAAPDWVTDWDGPYFVTIALADGADSPE